MFVKSFFVSLLAFWLVCVCSLVRLFVRSFIRSFVCFLVRLFVCLLVRSVIFNLFVLYIFG